MGQHQRRGSHEATYSVGGGVGKREPPGSVFPLEEPYAQSRLLGIVLCWPGRGAVWSAWSVPLTLLMWSVLVSVVLGGVLSSLLCSRSLSVMSCP